MRTSKKAILEELKGYLFMLIACVAYGTSTSLFLADNGIIAGGVTGLSVLINYLNPNLLIGMVSIAINLPILLLGLKFQGWKFILRCLITVATHGVVTDIIGALFPEPLTTDGVLASLYGGICQGIGIGLFVRYQFSSGGTELLGRVLSRFIKGLNIPVCVGILDGMIVVLGAILTQNPANMLYALIVVFVSTKVSEMVLVGLEKSKLCIIITDKGEEISKMLVEKSPRGVTMLDGTGMYTNKEHAVLLTCVKNQQLTQLKQIVKSIDEHAFIIINESVEVRGQGFKSLNQSDE
ncbi:MAG: YitT family protein [Clostridia bacterium]|nr:YitT family protein [Clostridia bacterium]